MLKILQVFCGFVSIVYSVFIFATVPGLSKTLRSRLEATYGKTDPKTMSSIDDECFYFYYIQYQRSAYLLLIGIVFVLFEVSSRVRKWLYFMNFGWGKAIAHFMLACFYLKIVFSRDDIFNYYGSIPGFIFVCCLVFCGFSIAHHGVEAECVDVLVTFET